MDDISLLRKLDRVTAPQDFEQRVMTQLARRRAALPQARRAQAFRYSLAGVAAALLVCFLVLNVFVLRNGPGRVQMAGRDATEAVKASDFVPITETVNYRNEVRDASSEPRTVYILEQVSNVSYKHIRY